jgi:hypothetical protein
VLIVTFGCTPLILSANPMARSQPHFVTSCDEKLSGGQYHKPGCLTAADYKESRISHFRRIGVSNTKFQALHYISPRQHGPTAANQEVLQRYAQCPGTTSNFCWRFNNRNPIHYSMPRFTASGTSSDYL